MKKKTRIDEIMNSLEDMQPAKAPEGGFSRIQQKLADQRKEYVLNQQKLRITRRNIAAVVAVAICANIWAISNYLNSDDGQVPETYNRLVTDLNLYENE